MVTPIGVAHSGSPYGLHLCTLWAVTQIFTHIHVRSHMVAAQKGSRRSSVSLILAEIAMPSLIFKMCSLLRHQNKLFGEFT